MSLIQRYITLLLFFMCGILAFSQSKEQILVIRIPYADTIPQELIDSIYRQEGKYILSYHPDMAHLIPEMRCRRIPEPCKIIEVNGVKFNMMCVEGEMYDYLIGQTEVTCALWKAVMGSLPKGNSGDNKPIYNVTWDECQEFITKLNELTGFYFRFPTVDEWRYAANGGQYKKDFIYSGSDNIDKVGWYSGNSVGMGVHEVAQLMPNALGVYDMTGNVWEWAESADGKHRYLGGSYAFNAESCLISKMGTAPSDDHTGSIGLRLVLDVHEYVDMGLSVKWATCNLGASYFTEAGDFYAWGETQPKDSYTVKNYKWYNGSANAITRYCTVDTLGNKGFTDGLTELKQEDDAAYMQKGGKWRMPSDSEWDELRQQCTWTLTERHGVSGYEVKSKINGNTIFIPVVGFRSGENIVLNYIGGYWSSSLNESKQTCALGLYINKDENRVGKYSNSSRHNGFLIRPVYDENKVTVTVNATPSTSKIGFLCIGYTRVGNTITVDKGKSVLWSVTNDRYLSQSDSLLNLTKDTTLNVTLAPFSEGNWVTLDTSKFEHVFDYYISRNRGAVAGKYVGWSYYILPVVEGETYRVTTKGGQLAAPWLVVSSLPDPETKTRATKVACSDLKGPVSVVSEEFTIPNGGVSG